MSVTFFIAIALSAMSAVTEIQVARPRLAHVQTVRAERREVRVETRRDSSGGQVPRLSGQAWAPVLHWKGTSATPRAPAAARS
jgi:hypothetical protein